eukprot:60522-Rhodomonas_salina.2
MEITIRHPIRARPKVRNSFVGGGVTESFPKDCSKFQDHKQVYLTRAQCRGDVVQGQCRLIGKCEELLKTLLDSWALCAAGLGSVPVKGANVDRR